MHHLGCEREQRISQHQPTSLPVTKSPLPAFLHTQIETGYRLTAVTVRKLEFEPDTYAFADKVRRFI